MSLILVISPLKAFSEDFLPENIFQLDQKFAHHVVVVEKSTHRLFLYENDNGNPKLLKKYQIATGKKIGNKTIEGDEKTPEGIYQFHKFRPGQELVNMYGETGLIYGAGAFTTNYPNVIDRRSGKTGGGIWLHSTDDDSRVGKGLDSRGCVVAVDADLKDISKYIDLKHTPVVIVQDLGFLKKSTWETNKEELLGTIHSWAKAWQEKDFDTYINSYSQKEFDNPRKGNYWQYRAYKKAIFSRTEKPEINLNHLSVLAFNNYAVATMEQDYKSELIQDVGKKILYLKKDENYQWKIVAEQWSKLDEQDSMAFVPAMRFFPNNGESLVRTPSRNTSNVKEN